MRQKGQKVDKGGSKMGQKAGKWHGKKWECL